MEAKTEACGCVSAITKEEACRCKTVEPVGNCGCADCGPLHLGIATVPMQPWEETYDAHKALLSGTIFPSLDLPFFVTGGETNG